MPVCEASHISQCLKLATSGFAVAQQRQCLRLATTASV